MKLINHSVNDFIDLVDSTEPTPGGGSVAALSVLEGVALFRMVANITMGKKKFQKLTDVEQHEFIKKTEQLGVIKHRIRDLIDKDTEAYNQIMVAYRLPKETTDEEVLRNQAIYSATLIATEVPYQVAGLGLQALDLASPLVSFALKSAMSDIGVGLWMVYAGIKGAIYNVKTNMVAFEDQETRTYYYSQVDEIDKKSSALLELLLPIIVAPFDK